MVRGFLRCATIKNNSVAHQTVFLSVLHVLCEKILETMRIAYKNYTKYNKTMAMSFSIIISGEKP